MKQHSYYLGQQKLAVPLGIWNSHFSLPSAFSLLPLRPTSYRFSDTCIYSDTCLLLAKNYTGSPLLETWCRELVYPLADHSFSPGGNSTVWWSRTSRGVSYVILKSGSEQVDSSLSVSETHFFSMCCNLKKKVYFLERNDVPDNHKWQKLHNFEKSYTLKQYFNHQILIKPSCSIYSFYVCISWGTK